MQNYLLKLNGGLLCLMLLASPAWAQPGGGFYPDANQPGAASSAVTTVEAARKLPDDSYVALEGYITGSANTGDAEEYLFKDATGSIKLEVSPSQWRGQKVTPSTKIRIVGEVDQNRLIGATEIEVKQLDIITSP